MYHLPSYLSHEAKALINGMLAVDPIKRITIPEIMQHPFFTIDALGASARSAGKPYQHAVKWKQTVPIPSAVRDMVVQECKPEKFKDCQVVFSGLDADVAGEIGVCALRSLSYVLRRLTGAADYI